VFQRNWGFFFSRTHEWEEYAEQCIEIACQTRDTILRGSEPDGLALAPGHVAHPFEPGAGLGLVAAADVAEHHLDQLRGLLLVEAVLPRARAR
jgi:hypothetical protein